MTCIVDRLGEAGVDIVEIGFLDDRQPENINRSIQPNTAALSRAYSNISKDHPTLVGMIDYGTCSLDNIESREDTILDGIRVIFKKKNMYNAARFGEGLKAKGYDLYLNMVSITSYSDEDIDEFANLVNGIMPVAVAIVDTYGLMHREQVQHYFELLDRKLDTRISIGYHSHNNFQLGYSNTLELLKIESDRSVILDATLYGMGKSAGNAPIELVAMNLNDNYGKDYDITQILEAIDNNIMPIYSKQYWGYSLNFYIAAKNDCHPNYVKYLIDKKTLSMRSIDSILDSIDDNVKLDYNENYIESLYQEYQAEELDDSVCIDALRESIGGRKVLVIAPGRTVRDSDELIRRYIDDNDPVTIGVNFIPPDMDVDYIFFNNTKRYSQNITNLNMSDVRTIATSNLTPANSAFDYPLNYEGLMGEDNEVWCNALVLILNLMKRLGVVDVALAGFDGFVKSADNYVGEDYDLGLDYKFLSVVNKRMKGKVKEYRRFMNIEFITQSQYDS